MFDPSVDNGGDRIAHLHMLRIMHSAIVRLEATKSGTPSLRDACPVTPLKISAEAKLVDIAFEKPIGVE